MLAPLVDDEALGGHDVELGVDQLSGQAFGRSAILRPAFFKLRPQAMHDKGEASAGLALVLIRIALDAAPGGAPGKGEGVIVKILRWGGVDGQKQE